jgi:hypothetical protein
MPATIADRIRAFGNFTQASGKIFFASPKTLLPIKGLGDGSEKFFPRPSHFYDSAVLHYDGSAGSQVDGTQPVVYAFAQEQIDEKDR